MPAINTAGVGPDVHPSKYFNQSETDLTESPPLSRMTSPFSLPEVVEAEALPKRGSGIGLRDFNKNYILFWNDVGLNLNRLTHTISGPQDGPPVSARALAILHVAIHDAYFGVIPNETPIGGMPKFGQYHVPKAESIPANKADHARDAVAAAAITVLNKLYINPNKSSLNAPANGIVAIHDLIDESIEGFRTAHGLYTTSAGYFYGVGVAESILGLLELKREEIGVDATGYHPKTNSKAYKPYYFDDEPSHPVRLRPIDPNNPLGPMKVTRPYHGPFYGTTATVLATTQDFKIADPYANPNSPASPPDPKYLESVEDVHRMGGAEGLASTKRRPDQTAAALFWAYDGANLIGTPPRLYNQIVRQIAYDKAPKPLNCEANNAEFARLLALVNVAMADAGIFCWREKYRYELWRPLSGVRQDPSDPAPKGFARPFWDVLGAPDTNSNKGGFKPPFPAYPSGHATFGAAAFQILRRFYHARDESAKDPKLSEAVKGIKTSQKSSVSGNDSTGSAQSNIQEEDSQAGKSTTADTTATGPLTATKPHEPFQGKDNIGFRFVSDELNGINRTLDLKYDPSHPITDQPGNVRTRLVLEFASLRHAIFSNAISRIWLGVHWHFDAFAGEDIMEPFEEAASGYEAEGVDNNPLKPMGYVQQYKCERDGSTKYKDVEKMDFFGTLGTTKAANGEMQNWWYGGVPLGILIADDIFTKGMKHEGSLPMLSV
jgi:vanadium chloroperoxidase